ncbi:MBL fold metallo-hydrolase [Thalassoroseus pseudoceratinae]|uniref:MBL fold metallo-hydrolase n=1 Tax=Thalassoroseus pseudoceratinae TaxID=2713176 RepID=UPI00142046CE|nr:MBL fold metallo-hydrolase [Thalassoroseus pseudoceratinae]
MNQSVESLRITFWGTQGSLQYFPDPTQVGEYADLIATDCLRRVFAMAEEKFGDKSFTIQDLLGGELDQASLAKLYQTIGRAAPAVYGGETTCAEIETSDGFVFVIDGGSGIRHFAKKRVLDWKDRDDRELTIFGTHDHLDHRIGLPFSSMCFAQPAFRLQVYGNYRFLAALDDRFAVFSQEVTEATHRDDPLDYRMMSAEFTGTQILCHDSPLETDQRVPNCSTHDAVTPIVIGETVITPFPTYHGSTPCLAYRFEHKGKSFVFCTDHELRHGAVADHPNQIRSEKTEESVRAHCQHVDVAYFDGQYLMDEYLGRVGTGNSQGVPRIDWGHSAIEDVVERARVCEIGRTFVGHHDPDREWLDRMKLDEWCHEQSVRLGRHIELAKDRQVINL